MSQLFVNNSTGTLAAAINNSATSISLVNATPFGAVVAPDYLMATLTDGMLIEIVKVAGISGNTLTVVRAQEGTSALMWGESTVIYAGLTAASATRLRTLTPDAATHTVAAGETVTGVSSFSNGVVVGNNAAIVGIYGIGIGYTANGNAYGVAMGYAASNRYGSNGVALGRSAQSGLGGIAIGYDAQASNASTGTDNGIAMGYGTRATTYGAIAVGYAAQAREQGIAIGTNANTAGTASEGVAIGHSAASTGNNAVAVGRAAVGANGGVALGYGADANDNSEALAIGQGAAARAYQSVAMGSGAEATGQQGVALGAYAKATQAGAIALAFGQALAVDSLAGNAVVNRCQKSIAFGKVAVIIADNWDDGGEIRMAGTEAIIATPTVDLSGGETWQASTVYTHGDVVKPTTPNGYQYRLWMFNATYTVCTTTSAGSEPTWPTTPGDSVAADGAGDGYWICMDLATGYDIALPSGMIFYPAEVSFEAQRVAGVTVAPVVSVGVSAAPGQYLNAVSLSGFSADNQVLRTALSGVQTGCTDLRFKLSTPATATRLMGRFLVRGVFVEARGHVAS